MKFLKLNLEIDPQPLSTRQSRAVAAHTAKFSIDADKNKDKTDGDVAGFLTEQVYYLLSSVYKDKMGDKIPATAEDLSDMLTMDEVCTFLDEQIKACGDNDFLMQSIKMLLQGAKKISSEMDKIVNDSVAKALQNT